MFRLLVSILFVHVMLLVGMFEVYFKSPIVPGLPPVPCPYKTPAKRLVLFIGDGLRADHFFDTCNAPFLREKVESGEAVSGISHTHLPTESRPGTVAIAAGVYEDPSAVFKGWQDNPVPVDSFFNRCKFSFAWGSPDIVHLFSRDAKNINASSYSEEDQSFDPQVSLSLNQWVFDNFVKFLEDCQTREECLHLIHEDKISFFFHFIGIDMAGHKSKPHSSPYNQVILQADGIMRNLTNIIDRLYHDNKTAYVFTSDHGMTDWGSHGAGSPQETRTPLVVWGSGVRKLAPKNAKYDPSSNEECHWAVSPDDLHDVEQADIATLMSTLLGVELPTNSMGAVPVPYLNYDRATIMSALLLNARQQYVLFNHLASLTKQQSSPMFFRPFTLSNVPLEHNMDTWSQEMVAKTITLDKDGFEREMSVIANQISEIKRGIEYYHTYFQNFLLFLLTMSFLGLIALIFGYLCFRSSSHSKGGSRQIIRIGKLRFSIGDTIFIFISIVVSFIHLVQALPLMFYAYSIMPVILWWKATDYFTHPSVLIEISRMPLRAGIKYFVLLLAGVELLYLSFYYRWVLSLIMTFLSISPWFCKKDSQLDTIPVLSWTASSLVLAIFPLLPVVGAPKIPFLVVFSGALYVTFAFVLMLRGGKIEINSLTTKFQMLLMMAVVVIVSYMDFFLPANGRKDIVNNISWTVLVLSPVSLFLSSKTSTARLFSVTLACGVPFTMLSSSYEALFLPILSVNMGTWVWMELNRSQKRSDVLLAPKSRPGLLPINEVSTGSLYLFFIIFSFFGIGNINSLNSFDIDWVRCFVDVFSPFTMTSLIVLKTGMPFFLVSCFMRHIISETKADYVNILLILLILSEAMGLMFLFKVTNTGSWLDIGTSISHYVIMEVSAFVVVITFFAAGFLLYPSSQQARMRRYAD